MRNTVMFYIIIFLWQHIDWKLSEIIGYSGKACIKGPKIYYPVILSIARTVPATGIMLPCATCHMQRRKTLSKTSAALRANISLEKWLQELTSRKNLELESHRQFVVVINLVLATPATSMAPDHTDPAVPSRPVIAMDRGVLLTG